MLSIELASTTSVVFRWWSARVEENGLKPEGLDDLYKVEQTLRFHGNFHWFDESGFSLNCCADGLRPVRFKIDRI